MIKTNNGLTITQAKLTTFPRLLATLLLLLLSPTLLLLVGLATFTLIGCLATTQPKTAQESGPCIVWNDEIKFPPRICVIFLTFRKYHVPHFFDVVKREFLKNILQQEDMVRMLHVRTTISISPTHGNTMFFVCRCILRNHFKRLLQIHRDFVEWMVAEEQLILTFRLGLFVIRHNFVDIMRHGTLEV